MTEMPLAGLKVIDLTIARAGPTAVRQLADWGADVIRIDAPVASEPIDRDSPDFLNLHRNKRSLQLDLKKESGRDVLHQLVRKADVLVENMRSPVKARLGFDWATLSALNARLVLGSISGFGQTGPDANRGGVDQIVQGVGGLMSLTGHPGQEPIRAGVAISDIAAGLQLANGILVALLEREKTGVGRWVHTSLLESMIGMLDFQAARWTIAGECPEAAGNDHPTLIPMGLFETRHGYLNVAAAWGKPWHAFCRAIGLPQLPEDVRFANARARSENRTALRSIVIEALARRSAAEWVEVFHEHDVPAGLVNRVDEVFEDAQVKHLRMTRSMEHPKLGTVEVIRNATQIEGIDARIERPTPEAGQHSDEILLELGLSREAIATLRADGVV